jgi:hypothetical protein
LYGVTDKDNLAVDIEIYQGIKTIASPTWQLKNGNFPTDFDWECSWYF